MALDATLKVPEPRVLPTQFPTLFTPFNRGPTPFQRDFTPFQPVFTPFLFRPFFWRNASRGSWRSPPLLEKKHVHPEIHRGLCLWFDCEKFQHNGTYTIHNCILSNHVGSLWTALIAIKQFRPLSVTPFIQFQLIIRFLGPKFRHYQKKHENNNYCSLFQKHKFETTTVLQLSSQVCVFILLPPAQAPMSQTRAPSVWSLWPRVKEC
jgi:hypothetical protein